MMGELLQDKDMGADLEKATIIDVTAENANAEERYDKEDADSGGGEKKFRAGEFKLRIKDQWRNKSHAELKGEIESQLKEQGLADAPAEFIDQLVKNVSKDLSKKTHWQNVKSFVRFGVLFSAAISVALFFSLMSQTADKYVSRDELRNALTNAVAKDSNIDDIKLVYLHEVSNPADTIWPLIKPYLYYEKSSLSLLQVLGDLKVSKLKVVGDLDSKDIEFLSRLDSLIAEHNKVNPFDGLDEQSLRDFRGISYKLAEVEYEKIRDELLNLNSAIKEKNSIIGQYLSSSNLSLYVSIGAFVFSIIVTLWQFFPNRRSSQKQLIAEVIGEHMAKR